MSDANQSTITPLPIVMVAPTGARRSRADHPALPISIEEVTNTTIDCWNQGARGVHVHVRDSNEKHTLDVELYQQAISSIRKALPDIYIQITTEAVGQYSAAEQRDVVRKLKPTSASIALSELYSDNEMQENRDFLSWCHASGIGIQHILYSADDLEPFESLIKSGDINKDTLQLIYVLGRYTKDQQSTPSDLDPLTDWLERTGIKADWAVCAFGVSETPCLVEARRRGGKVRVGFENSLWHQDGQFAKNNGERVAEVVSMIEKLS